MSFGLIALLAVVVPQGASGVKSVVRSKQSWKVVNETPASLDEIAVRNVHVDASGETRQVMTEIKQKLSAEEKTLQALEAKFDALERNMNHGADALLSTSSVIKSCAPTPVPTSSIPLLLNFDKCNVGETWMDTSGNNDNAVKGSNGVTAASEYYKLDGTTGYFYIQNLKFKDVAIMHLEAVVEFRTTFKGNSMSDNWSFLDFDRSEWFNVYVRGDTGQAAMSTTGSDVSAMDEVVGTSNLSDGNWHTVKYSFTTDGSTSSHQIDVDGTIEKTVTGKHLAGIGKLGTQRYGFIGDGSEATSQDGSRNNIYFDGDIRRVLLKASHSYSTPAPAPPPAPLPVNYSSSCQVTVYEHWAEGVQASASNSTAKMLTASTNWHSSFPTGATQVLDGVGHHPLNAQVSNKVSSVKVTGQCCKAYGYTDAVCSVNTHGTPSAISSATLAEAGSVLGAGVVTPGTNLQSFWGCNDCVQCVNVVQQC